MPAEQQHLVPAEARQAWPLRAEGFGLGDCCVQPASARGAADTTTIAARMHAIVSVVESGCAIARTPRVTSCSLIISPPPLADTASPRTRQQENIQDIPSLELPPCTEHAHPIDVHAAHHHCPSARMWQQISTTSSRHAASAARFMTVSIIFCWIMIQFTESLCHPS